MIRTCLTLFWVAAPVAGQQLEIYHIDVDQGDATLFILPDSSAFLVDAGLDGSQDRAVVLRVSGQFYTVEVPRSGLLRQFEIEKPD